ncbi:integrin alpha-X-like, partial [Excalfactoria chinensis]|uniref:integrin alpha-X-like n=1 Tax=Excalfactoria chinensis TaxID=46218 RepID=UPI003B3B2074
MGPMALGMAMAANGSQLLTCGPTAQRMCGENAEVPGFCFLLFSSRSLQTTPRDCPTSASDIVFLVDGSGSVAQFDFQRMKIFIIEIIRRFRGTNTRFAVVQFSTSVRLHLSFADFDRLAPPELERRVMSVEQLSALTATATAIRTVLSQVFPLSRPDAHKVLLVVTDGQKYGDALSYDDVIPQADAERVLRYAIGVGSAFKDPKAEAELQLIASKPPQAHVFRVDNFEALRGIQEQLQEKIFAIEGTRAAFGSSFQLEMAQEGFSALLTPDGAVLGAVGAYDWAGGVFVYGADGKVAFVNASEGEGGVSDAYLGYAIESLSLGGLRALVLGAPRYRHVGRLLLFVLHGGKWELRSDAVGQQVGSYFGAALCALETSGGGAALLVGAPMFYGESAGGRVEVCAVLPQGRVLRCRQTLRGQAGHPLGRFGASIARLGDIDGDGLQDVAVGAPMEDEERGAVYVFRGERDGVSDRYSQRIAGSVFRSAPQHFGKALSGGRDLTGDGLPDVAVGAQGQVLLLRSPPLLHVDAELTFIPPEIPTSALGCQRAEEEEPSPAGAAPVSTAELCVVGTRKSRDSLGPVGATLLFQLQLDPGRAARAVFAPGGARLNGSVPVGEGRRCRTFRVALTGCPADTLSPVALRAELEARGDALQHAQGMRVAVSSDSRRDVTGTLPFERNCGEDNQCVPDLRLALSFSGLEELVVGATEEVTVTVTVHNVGEDAYGAHVELRHPKALSYRKAAVLQPHRRSLAQHCSSASPGGGHILCNISHPVLWAGQQLVFAVTMDVPHEAELGDRAEVVATASSFPPPVGSAAAVAAVPVLYNVVLLLTSSPSSTRLVPAGHVTLQHRYQLSVRGSRRPPGSAAIRVPTALNGAELWDELRVHGPKVCESAPYSSGVRDPIPLLQQNPVLDCSVAACWEWRCPWGDPLPPEGVEFSIEGRLQMDWGQQLPLPHVELQSSAHLRPEGRSYRNVGRDSVQVLTELRPSPPPFPLFPVLGAVLAGLLLAAAAGAALWKVGFFRRRYKELREGGAEGGGAEGGGAEGSVGGAEK